MTYRKGKEIISITNIPQRKKKALLVGNELYAEKVASFDDDEAAEIFAKQLEYFLGIKEKT